jgi:hypothetical protein
MAPQKLNKAQITVLRWIAEGSPEDVMQGHTHRTSAAALHSRENWGMIRPERGAPSRILAPR